MSIFNWVQKYGLLAIAKINQQLGNLQQGIMPEIEAISEEISQLPLIIGADGVKVPFRPFAKSPKGKIVWKEVKVGVLARLGQRIKRNGQARGRYLFMLFRDQP